MKAVVTGVAGQDGFYMTKLLVSKGVAVLGLTSDIAHATAEFRGEVNAGLELVEFDYTVIGTFSKVVSDYRPDFIFNFAARATGQGMFDDPRGMMRLNAAFVVDILEALRHDSRRNTITFCQASSSEMFGNVDEAPQTESTPFRPKSPYGASKVYAHNMVNIYRAAYGLRCCSAILYNHESVRRSTKFVTKKIANGAARIKLGLDDNLRLGSLDVTRDWGYAPEYVDAMFLMAVADRLTDYVVSTGISNAIRRLCEVAFRHLGLDYTTYIRVDTSSERMVESVGLHGKPDKIRKELGWSATRTIDQVVIELVDHEMETLKNTCIL